MRISDDKEFNVWVASRLGMMREVRVIIMIKFIMNSIMMDNLHKQT